ncbi:hypothetical protein DFJ77DRAFT_471383 [Powellomyces hirtus]|nr:hypothetical protein DFJ77DRAFT_471383 [Powellomyces hirtus]
MRYIHQDCLEEWLQHSKKKQCEICNYPFSFTSIYSEHAPERISVTFFLTIVSRRLLSLAKFYLRTFLAAFVWLVGVPYLTVWIWRLHFIHLNPSVILQGHPFRAVFGYSPGNETSSVNETQSVTDASPPSNDTVSPVDTVLRSFFTDVFEGQIIASIAVVICLAFLCLREYVVMNTPLDGQGNPMNVPEVPAMVPNPPAQNAHPVRPIFGRRDLLPLNDVGDMEEGGDDQERRYAEDIELNVRDILRETAATEAADLPGAIGDDGLDEEPDAPFTKVDEVIGSTGEIELNHSTAGIRRRRSAGGSDDHNQSWRPQSLQSDDLHSRSSHFATEVRKGLGAPGDSAASSSSNSTESLNDNDDTLDHTDLVLERKLLARERKFLSAAAYDEQQYRQRQHGVDKGKGKAPVGEYDGETEHDGSTASRQSRSQSSVIDHDLGMKRQHSSSSSLSRSGTRSGAHSGRSSAVSLETGMNGSSSFNAAPIARARSVQRPAMHASEQDIRSPSPGHWRRLSRSGSRTGVRDTDTDLEMFKRKLSASSGYSEEMDGNSDDDKNTSEFGQLQSAHRVASDYEEEMYKWKLAQLSDGKLDDGAALDELNVLQQADTDLEIYKKKLLLNHKLELNRSTQLQDDYTDSSMSDDSGDRIQQPLVPPAEPVRELPVVAAPAPPPPVAPPAANVDEDVNNFDVIGNNDVNAFLELVGVQGPLENLMQNVVMVVLIIAVALFVGVWTPYWIGRGVTYFVKDVYAPILERVLNTLQGLTDPLLDPIIDVAILSAKYLGFGFARRSDWNGSGHWNGTGHNTSDTLPKNLTEKYNAALPHAVNGSQQRRQKIDLGLRSNGSTPALSIIGVTDNVANFSVIISDKNITLPKLNETSVAGSEGSEVKSNSTADTAGLLFGIPDKVVYTAIGYITQLFFILDYARRTGMLRHPYAQTMKRITIKWLLYLVMAIKFAFFLIVELGVFPLFCGVLIDMCTLPLFGPHATIASRWAFYRAHPWTSEFLHWVAGTTFMFQFALYVSTVREIVRPGVMWFIRDPNDEQFHPMNDILERPVLTQLRKLGVGTVMYATMVIGGVGGVVGLIWCHDHFLAPAKGPSRMWPLQWDLSEPMSEFPVDLLIFHFVVPWTIAWIRPKRILRRVVAVWFRWIAASLRLTSFLFGGSSKGDESDDEIDVEEDVDVDVSASNRDHGDDPTLLTSLDTSGALDSDSNISEPDLALLSADNAHRLNHDSGNDGDDEDEIHEHIPAVDSSSSAGAAEPPKIQRKRPRREFRYMRVPNNDHVEVIPGERMLIPMRANDPIMGRAGETEEEVKLNWTRVYVPEHFKTRVALLIYMQWMSGVILVASLITIPLYVGRKFFIAAINYIPRMDASMESVVANATAANGAAVTLSNFTIPTAIDITAGNAANVTANATRKIMLRLDLPVHDMYAYAVGLFLLFMTVYPIIYAWSWVVTWRRIEHRRIGRGRRGRPDVQALAPVPLIGEPIEHAPSRPVRRTPWKRAIKRWLRIGARWMTIASKLLFLGTMFGIVLPLMEGVVFDLYLIQPFKPLVTAKAARTMAAPPRRHIGIDLTNPLARTIIQALLQDWALGAVYMKIAWALIMVGPETEVQRVLREFVDNGIRRVRVRPVWRTVILPLFSICLGLAAGPLIAGLLLQKVLAKGTITAEALRWTFPASLLLSLALGGVWLCGRAIKRWMERVREEQYLVGRKLHNLEDPAAQPQAEGLEPPQTPLLPPPVPHDAEAADLEEREA